MGELTKEQLIQVQHIQSLKQKRINANSQIQAKFDMLDNLQDKFLFLYDLILQNQLEFAKWNKTDYIFSHEYRQNLIKKCKTFTKKEDFINLLVNEVIKPLGQGHCYLFERNTSENFLSSRNFKDKEDDNNFQYEFLDDDTLYLKIKSFSKAYFNFDKTKAQILKQKLQDRKINNFILDIRGNGGGTDSYISLIMQLLQAKMEYRLEWYNILLHEKEGYKITHNFGNNTYNYYVLTDNRVFSAAEVVTKAFKQNGATIIGSKTCGEAGISPELQMKIFSYKNSEGKDVNLILQIPISAPIDTNGNINYEFTYTKPDIECDANDALKIVSDLRKKTITEYHNFI